MQEPKSSHVYFSTEAKKPRDSDLSKDQLGMVRGKMGGHH